MHGPAGTGKTRACLEKDHWVLQKYPGARVLLVRATRTSLTESALVTFENKVVVPGPIVPQHIKRQFRHSYEYKNGSALITGGMDNEDRIMSTEYDIIHVVEATELSEANADKLTTRLRNGIVPYQQLVLECNPSGPSHWIKKWIDSGRAAEIPSRHADNPSVTQQYLDRLSKMTGSRHARLFLGQWAASEGLVYENFDRSMHIIDEMPKGWETWPKYRSIDFGYTNPFVCQWWAVDHDGRAYLYREWYRQGITVKGHAEKIKELSGSEKYVHTISDHDAEDRATLRDAGIETFPARKDVSPGIQAVSERLRPAGDGKARLFLLRSALVGADAMLREKGRPQGLIAELEGYMWSQQKDGSTAKEDPVKLNDHSCDAMRYFVMSIESPELPSVWVDDGDVSTNNMEEW